MLSLSSKLNEIINCPNCKHKGTLKKNNEVEYVCCKCLCSMSLNNNVLCMQELEFSDTDSNDYELGTKHRYQTNEYAANYHKRYKRISNIYPYIIAKRETQGVFELTECISDEVETLLDIPAGTGKLADMHNRFDYSFVAADVSAHMLKKGIKEWEKCRNLIGLVQTDITKSSFVDNAFDCLVCLRLMHRLPQKVVLDALKEISRITKKYLIVSNGLTSNLSAYIRPKKITKNEISLDKKSWYAMLSTIGFIEKEFYIARGISKGIITLVKIKE